MAGAARSVAVRPAMMPLMRPNLSSSSSFLGGSSFITSIATTSAPVRGSLVVMAAGGKSMACTLGGTRRKRRRVSGFRARMATKNGQKVLAARKKKGRHSLCPASEKSSAGKKP